MSFKGAKKALYRGPHQLIGKKSADDQQIKNWEHDLQNAVAGLEFLIVQERKWCKCLGSILDNLLGSMDTFEQLHSPFDRKDKKADQELVSDQNEDFSNVTVNEIRQAKRLFRIIYDQVTQRMEVSKDRFVDQCEEMKEYIRSSLKLITKRNHKKIDYDMYHNSVEKILKSSSFNEKEKAKLETTKSHMYDTRTVFLDLDAKVKLMIPQVLETLSEFLHKLTVKFYYQSRDIFRFVTRNMDKFVQLQGVVVYGQETEYASILNNWKERIEQAQHKLNSLDLLNDYKAFQEKTFLDKTGQQMNHFTGHVVGSAMGFTSSLYTKTLNPHQKLNLRTLHIENPVRPASRDGMFVTATDPLSYIINETIVAEEVVDDDDAQSWLKPLSLEKRLDDTQTTTPSTLESVPVTPVTPSTAISSPLIDPGSETAKYLSVSVDAIRTRLRDTATHPEIDAAPVTAREDHQPEERTLLEVAKAKSSFAAAFIKERGIIRTV
ncbi:hypothetical protein KL911_000602 [Ogataea haglerorum]|uniref:uncharacterized protein n=1 Tax=Ogataea haglerorum TaxID=1937702 RepID=UPI001C8AC57E|nr:uncharacterized protein KL911_000602 [Ogataea haglerorum]KAG7757626.1 hypothetical protein KL911_000602 [Ogataea haglerorum]